MNRNIAKQAIFNVLGSAFVQVEDLLDIIEQLPIPEVGVELMLGTYVKPKYNMTGRELPRETKREFKKFHRFTNQITYTYQHQETVEGWFPNEKQNSKETFVCGVYDSENGAKSLDMKKDEFMKTHSRGYYVVRVNEDVYEKTVSVEEWNS